MLVEGDHFGEIGLIYNCPRTATVISRNYNTIARLSKLKFRALVSEIPEIKSALQMHTLKYNYKKKKFIKQVFERISYLSELEDEVFAYLFFKFKQNTY